MQRASGAYPSASYCQINTLCVPDSACTSPKRAAGELSPSVNSAEQEPRDRIGVNSSKLSCEYPESLSQSGEMPHFVEPKLRDPRPAYRVGYSRFVGSLTLGGTG